MKLIVGLGNPGAEYECSRHNVGFRVLDRLVDRFRFGDEVHEKDAYTRKGKIAGRSVMIAFPQTFMNRSGFAVAGLVRAYLESLEDLVVVYDDIDLELGRIRIRQGGSAGTHNGMRSIIESLGSTDFPRVRLGVRGEGIGEMPLSDYVLDDFSREEVSIAEQMTDETVEALVMIVRGDIRRAMNQMNSREKEEVEE